uniref:Chitin-binding type-2 domain-containing protein n=1 Tax=Anopheles atroparvus TaxID=41427 RepID=A0A182JGL3_ANOAO
MVAVRTMQGTIDVTAVLGLALVGLLLSSASARFISDNICLAMPNGQKLPITDDCGSYIVCEYNVQKIQHCTAGTLFDPVAMVCNWAAFVKCGQTPSLPPILIAPTSSPVTIPTAPTPPRLPTMLPSIPTAPTAPPTPAVQSTTTRKPTQPAIIPTAPTAPPMAATTMSSVATIRPTTTLRPVATTPQYNAPLNPYPFCTPDEFSFTAHPTACESYYICAYGKLILHSCGHGVYWNTATNQCDFPENTDCTNLPNPAAPENSTPSAETTTISIIPDCYGTDIFYPNYADCSQYYICIGLHPILMSCPTNFLWNSKVSQCEHPANAVCAQK